MMYLHDDRDLFSNMVMIAAERLGINNDIIEKDYYVTLILKELAGTQYPVVFKGGTSLSKAYGIIDRFSEDIDITFTEHLGEARRKRLKYEMLKTISYKLGLEIKNWDSIESDKNYNHYDFYYTSVADTSMGGLQPYVKLETALMSYAFPTEIREINNYINLTLAEEEPELIDEFGLHPFSMRVQTLERTLIDKIFAVCDYYLLERPYRNSRHLYDIFKLGEAVTIDENFIRLTEVVRKQRHKMGDAIAPAASENIIIPEITEKIVSKDFYKADYENVTSKLITDGISYESVKQYYQNIVMKIFASNK